MLVMLFICERGRRYHFHPPSAHVVFGEPILLYFAKNVIEI